MYFPINNSKSKNCALKITVVKKKSVWYAFIFITTFLKIF